MRLSRRAKYKNSRWIQSDRGPGAALRVGDGWAAINAPAAPRSSSADPRGVAAAGAPPDALRQDGAASVRSRNRSLPAAARACPAPAPARGPAPAWIARHTRSCRSLLSAKIGLRRCRRRQARGSIGPPAGARERRRTAREIAARQRAGRDGDAQAATRLVNGVVGAEIGERSRAHAQQLPFRPWLARMNAARPWRRLL